MPSIAHHHAEWLSLLEISGPFLSMPVLLEALPQGLDARDAELANELRAAYEEWADNQGGLQPDPAIHTAWARYVLETALDLERALAIREQALGPAHPDTAQSLNNLGVLLRTAGDLVAARPYYERALAIFEQALGPDHPDTAQSLNNLAILCYYQNELEEAARLMRRALAICETKLGPDHPDTQRSRQNLAAIEERLQGK